jgi:hypothetical protein
MGGELRTGCILRGVRSAAFVAFLCLLGAPALADAGCPRFVKASDGLPTRGEWRTHPALGDVNEDGHLDVAGLPRKGRGPGVWLGDGQGAWKEASTGLRIPGFTCGVGVDFADIDGDGHLDLGVADHCNGIFIFKGNGEGLWTIRSSPAIGSAERGYEDLQFADVDGDGHVDLVAVGAFRGGISLFLGDGQGGWRQADVGLPDTGYAPDLKVADVDGDGRLDVVASLYVDRHDPRVDSRRLPIVWLQGEDGRFHDSSEGISDEGNFRGVDVGDVNGDGFVDLVVSGGRLPSRPPLLVYLGDGGSSWRAPPAGHPPADSLGYFESVALADLDRDGKLDLVASSSNEVALYVWRGDGKGGFERCTETGLPAGRSKMRGWGVTVGDVNADGLLDIATGFGRASQGGIEVWVQKSRGAAAASR